VLYYKLVLKNSTIGICSKVVLTVQKVRMIYGSTL